MANPECMDNQPQRQTINTFIQRHNKDGRYGFAGLRVPVRIEARQNDDELIALDGEVRLYTKDLNPDPNDRQSRRNPVFISFNKDSFSIPESGCTNQNEDSEGNLRVNGKMLHGVVDPITGETQSPSEEDAREQNLMSCEDFNTFVRGVVYWSEG